MSKIISQTKAIEDCSISVLNQCYELLCKEFAGVYFDNFVRDFNEKDVVMLIEIDNKIVGFSTLMLIDLPIPGRSVKAVFSGDTAVLREYRGSSGIGVEIGNFFIQTIKRFPSYEIYYVLISKGWRTYRILPSFFNDFSPRYDMSISDYDKSVMDTFGLVKYPNHYDPDSGLLVFNGDVERLKLESLDAVPPIKMDSHTDFFLKRNPDYLKGNELVCIARVTPKNFAGAMIRFIAHGDKKQKEIL